MTREQPPGIGNQFFTLVDTSFTPTALQMSSDIPEPVIPEQGDLNPREIGLWHISVLAFGVSAELNGIDPEKLEGQQADTYDLYKTLREDSIRGEFQSTGDALEDVRQLGYGAVAQLANEYPQSVAMYRQGIELGLQRLQQALKNSCN